MGIFYQRDSKVPTVHKGINKEHSRMYGMTTTRIFKLSPKVDINIIRRLSACCGAQTESRSLHANIIEDRRGAATIALGYIIIVFLLLRTRSYVARCSLFGDDYCRQILKCSFIFLTFWINTSDGCWRKRWLRGARKRVFQLNVPLKLFS
jgi:hypothetical protein